MTRGAGAAFSALICPQNALVPNKAVALYHLCFLLIPILEFDYASICLLHAFCMSASHIWAAGMLGPPRPAPLVS